MLPSASIIKNPSSFFVFCCVTLCSPRKLSHWIISNSSKSHNCDLLVRFSHPNLLSCCQCCCYPLLCVLLCGVCQAPIWTLLPTISWFKFKLLSWLSDCILQTQHYHTLFIHAAVLWSMSTTSQLPKLPWLTQPICFSTTLGPLCRAASPH